MKGMTMSKTEMISELADKYTKAELMDIADKEDVTYSPRGSKVEIAREIVEMRTFLDDVEACDEGEQIDQETGEDVAPAAGEAEEAAEMTTTSTTYTTTSVNVDAEVDASANTVEPMILPDPEPPASPVGTGDTAEIVEAQKAVALAIAGYNQASGGGRTPAPKARAAKTSAKQALCNLLNAKVNE